VIELAQRRHATVELSCGNATQPDELEAVGSTRAAVSSTTEDFSTAAVNGPWPEQWAV
jgi:hypothetical protein